MAYDGGRVRFEPLRSLAFGSISGTYAAIGTPFANPARTIMIDNSTDANVIISFDGVNDHMFVASFSGRIIDYATNRQSTTDKLEQAAGTTVYVKQLAAPSQGSVYVGLVYAASN